MIEAHSSERSRVKASRSHGAAALAVLALGACDDHGTGDIGRIEVPQGRLWGARFDPGGQVLSFAYGDEEKIGTLDIDEGTFRELTPGASYLTGTAWSADGAFIYYNGADGIGRISSDIGQVTMVNSSFATLGVDASPDGTRLAYGINGSDARIYDIATRVERPLDRPCQAIRFNPAGDKVACISGGALIVIELATDLETVVIEEGLPFIAGVDWYRDGQELLFTGEDGIERIRLDGTEHHLVHGAFAAIEVDLSQNEDAIVFGQNGDDALTLLKL